ncbi:hypothetical protein ABZY19_21380 [Streptomyces sp. NPDC006475]|uniref:hypothetical protein n=1 Tax=Streptomyces sp. NPDC006475 TaxID=3155719 RepID=UPI0033A9B163
MSSISALSFSPEHQAEEHFAFRLEPAVQVADDLAVATVQDGTLHVRLGLDTVDVRPACDDFARLLSHTFPYTDCLVGDDHVLLRLHGDLETGPLHPLAARHGCLRLRAEGPATAH